MRHHTVEELASRGLLPTSDPYMAYRPAPRRRPWWLRLRDRLVSTWVVADPDPELSNLDRWDGLR